MDRRATALIVLPFFFPFPPPLSFRYPQGRHRSGAGTVKVESLATPVVSLGPSLPSLGGGANTTVAVLPRWTHSVQEGDIEGSPAGFWEEIHDVTLEYGGLTLPLLPLLKSPFLLPLLPSRRASTNPGLYYKLHNAHRPVNMKKTTIKRRKRVPPAANAQVSCMSRDDRKGEADPFAPAQNRAAMTDASARNPTAGDSPLKAADQAGSAGDDSSAGPAPKRRKTTKKAAAAAEAAAAAAAASSTTNEAPSAVRNSPPGSTIHDLAAIASQISGPSPAAQPPHSHAGHAPPIPSPSLPHTHAHQHAHPHAPHAGHAHAHHHHHHHVSPHALASGRMPLASPPFASSSASPHLTIATTTGGLNLDTPLQLLTLRDLVAFHDGLQHELGAMREFMSRTEQHLVQGDRLVGVLESAIAAAGAPAPPAPAPTPAPVVSSPRPQEPKEAPPEPIITGAGSNITQGRRTEQDLEEYLAGLPEMAAVPLPLRKKSEGAVMAVAAGSPASAEKNGVTVLETKVEEKEKENTGEQ